MNNGLVKADIRKIIEGAFSDLEEIQSIEQSFGVWVAIFRRKGIDYVQNFEISEDGVKANSKYCADTDVLQAALNNYITKNNLCRGFLY